MILSLPTIFFLFSFCFILRDRDLSVVFLFFFPLHIFPSELMMFEVRFPLFWVVVGAANILLGLMWVEVDSYVVFPFFRWLHLLLWIFWKNERKLGKRFPERDDANRLRPERDFLPLGCIFFFFLCLGLSFSERKPLQNGFKGKQFSGLLI